MLQGLAQLLRELSHIDLSSLSLSALLHQASIVIFFGVAALLALAALGYAAYLLFGTGVWIANCFVSAEARRQLAWFVALCAIVLAVNYGCSVMTGSPPMGRNQEWRFQ